MEGWKPKYDLEKGINKYKEYLNEGVDISKLMNISIIG